MTGTDLANEVLGLATCLNAALAEQLREEDERRAQAVLKAFEPLANLAKPPQEDRCVECPTCHGRGYVFVEDADGN
jgi:hypothetical protein